MDRTQLSRSKPETVSPVIETCLSLSLPVDRGYRIGQLCFCRSKTFLRPHRSLRFICHSSSAARASPWNCNLIHDVNLVRSDLSDCLDHLGNCLHCAGQSKLNWFGKTPLRKKRTGDNQLYFSNNRTP